MKQRTFGLLVLVVLLSLMVIPVMASSQPGQVSDPIVPSTTQDFLKWLIGAGGSIMAVSWAFERMAWFQKLTSEARQYVMFGAAAVVGCGALATLTYTPAYILDAITPYFLIVASTFAVVFLSNAFHKVDAK